MPHSGLNGYSNKKEHRPKCGSNPALALLSLLVFQSL